MSEPTITVFDLGHAMVALVGGVLCIWWDGKTCKVRCIATPGKRGKERWAENKRALVTV